LVRDHGLAALLFKAFGASGFSDALEPEERDFMFASWQDRDACFGMLNWYRAAALDVPPVDAPYEVPAGWEPPALPRLAIPTLVIWGMDDTALPPCNLDGLNELVADLAIAKIPECGHFVQWEKPDAVTAAMDAFFARTGNAGGA
jgi:pimeloyl-ACP methyl ester carboxylesterase